MTLQVGINGFGRMGRLTLRAAWGDPALAFAHINDPAADAATLAHLLICTRGRKVVACWGERCAHGGALVAVQRVEELPLPQVPHLERGVLWGMVRIGHVEKTHSVRSGVPWQTVTRRVQCAGMTCVCMSRLGQVVNTTMKRVLGSGAQGNTSK